MLVIDYQCVDKNSEGFGSIKETSCNATTSTVINNYCKGALIDFARDFGSICCVVCVRVF